MFFIPNSHFIPFLGIRTPQSFAHVTTAQLSWHVQNFVSITWLSYWWEQNRSFVESKLQWKMCSWNQPHDIILFQHTHHCTDRQTDSYHAELILGNIKSYLNFPTFLSPGFEFSITAQYWNDTGRWNPSLRKTRTLLYCTVNTIVADDLVTSIVMVWSNFPQIFLFQHQKG